MYFLCSKARNLCVNTAIYYSHAPMYVCRTCACDHPTTCAHVKWFLQQLQWATCTCPGMQAAYDWSLTSNAKMLMYSLLATCCTYCHIKCWFEYSDSLWIITFLSEQDAFTYIMHRTDTWWHTLCSTRCPLNQHTYKCTLECYRSTD